MAVRCKMQFVSIKESAWNSGKEVTFQCTYDQSIPEDQRFAKATPSGSMTLWVDNPAALEQWKLGEYYYVDFTPAPKP